MDDGLGGEEADGAGEGDGKARGEGLGEGAVFGVVVACGVGFLKGARFAFEYGVGGGFGVEEEGCEHEEGIKYGERPEEPAPADGLGNEAPNNWAKRWAKEGDEGCDCKGLSPFVGLPDVC